LHFSPNNRDDILSPVVFLTRKLEKKEKKNTPESLLKYQFEKIFCQQFNHYL
jgi:hypothetical protein